MKITLNLSIGAPTIQEQITKAKIKIYDKQVISILDKHVEKIDWLLGFGMLTRTEYNRIKSRIETRLNKHLSQFK